MKLFSSPLLSHGKGIAMFCCIISLCSYANQADLLAPEITLNGDQKMTQPYGVEYQELGAIARDQHDGEVEVTVYSGVNVHQVGDYRVFYTATDLSGNSASLTRIVSVTDQTSPELTLHGQNEIDIPFKVTYQEPGARAVDNVDGKLEVTISGSVDTSNVGQYTLTYSAIDEAGNESTLTRRVNVIDSVAPVISLNATQVLKHAYGTEYQELGAVAFDDVDGEVEVVTSGSVDINAIGANTISYSAKDVAGNQSTLTRTVHVTDLTPPILTLNGQSQVTAAYGIKYDDLGALANDDLDGAVDVRMTGKVNTQVIGEHTITYHAQDAAGNLSRKTRSVSVLDLTAPVITLNGSADSIATYGFEYKELGATAKDDLDGDVSVDITGSVNSHALGDYTVSYSAKDTAGNESRLTRKVKVQDLTAPVIRLNGDEAIITPYGLEYNELGATATDDLDPQVHVEVLGKIDTLAIGEQSITYRAMDAAGNQSTLTRKVTVADLTAPIITLNEADTLITAYGFAYIEPGAIATDNLDSRVEVTAVGEVNSNVLGDYKVTYSAQDKAGNQSTLSRTVTVKDLTPPVITLNGESSLTSIYLEKYIELGATASDDLDRNVDVEISGEVNNSQLGDYRITYSATDKAGNTGKYTRTVSVIDVTAPVITLNGGSELLLDYPKEYVELGATASDDVDKEIKVVISGHVDIENVGENILTYSATDLSGNRSTLQRKVTVVDVTPPVITLNGANPLTHAYGFEYIDTGAIALDDVDGGVTVNTQTSVNVDQLNDYTVTYTATDAAGNQATATRNVAVRDLTPPVINLSGANPIVIGVGRGYVEYGATAMDNVDGKTVVDAPKGQVDGDSIGIYPLTYTTTDVAGNRSRVTRKVHIVEPRPFISKWKTTSNNDTLTIKVNEALSGFDYTVNWGDGSALESFKDSNANHTYNTAGVYTVTISGDFPGLAGCEGDEDSLVSIEQWGDIAWQSFDSAFMDCQNLVVNDKQVPDLSKVTSMRYAFSGATNFNSDISLWDVSSVTDMSYMFRGAKAFNQDLSRWDVSAVTDMSYMFRHASTFNQDISRWDLSSVENTWYMFSYASAFDQDISHWNVSAVTKMTGMFSNATAFNQDISRWDVSAVTMMNLMFFNASSFNQDISRWDVSGVTYMYHMFSNAVAFNQDISRWNVGNVSNMSNMFRGASAFNQDLGRWNVSGVKNFSGMFANASSFNQDISGWDVSVAKNMNAMFLNATTFNQDLGAWNVQKVTDMSSMFEGATRFDQNIERWDVSAVKTMQKMFAGASAFDQNLGSWDVSSVTNMEQMFAGASSFDQNLGDWDISAVTTMYEMFEGVTLSEKNYDALLNHWSKRDVQQDVFFSAGDSVYSQAAQSAVDILTKKRWRIADGASL